VIDIRLLRDKPDEVRAAYERLGATVDLDGVTAADARVRDLKNESQTMQAEQNRLSKEIGRAAAGEARERAKADSTALKEKIESSKASSSQPRRAWIRCSSSCRTCRTRRCRSARTRAKTSCCARRAEAQLRFHPQAALGPRHRAGHHRLRARREDLGTRFYVLKGWGARLQRALITLMLDLHTQKHGYLEIYPPYMVRRECLVGTGNLPKFGDNLYRDAVEDFWFIPTAEVPVTNLYRDEIVDGARLPIKHVAFTACFRREQMAAGRDTRGIKRGTSSIRSSS
jgi:seryl-tRNA synthetase